jgi:hypothetical protein
MVRSTWKRQETEMNVQETTGIRDLTAQELDQVNGGTGYDATLGLAIGVGIGIVGALIGGFLGWLFD